jgi:hypothetical protein
VHGAGEQQRHDLMAPLLYPQQEREKLLELVVVCFVVLIHAGFYLCHIYGTQYTYLLLLLCYFNQYYEECGGSYEMGEVMGDRNQYKNNCRCIIYVSFKSFDATASSNFRLVTVIMQEYHIILMHPVLF